MVILLIGNGFDLAHGYPTTYIDFMKFVRQYRFYLKNNKFMEDLYKSFFSYLEETNPDAFHEIDALTKDNLLLTYFFNVIKGSNKHDWIDFENELSKLIQVLDEVDCSSKEQFDNGLSTFVLTKRQAGVLYHLNNLAADGLGNYYITNNYLDDVFNELLSGLKKVRRCLELYLAVLIN